MTVVEIVVVVVVIMMLMIMMTVMKNITVVVVVMVMAAGIRIINVRIEPPVCCSRGRCLGKRGSQG